MTGDLGLSTARLAEIGSSLYRGVTYKGRPAWQSWLADGLGIDGVTVRRWLMDDAASRRMIPGPMASLLMAASGIAVELRMWGQPRGTLIVDRMADLILELSAEEVLSGTRARREKSL